MPRWSDLEPSTKYWTAAAIVVAIILIIAGWYGYFSTGG